MEGGEEKLQWDALPVVSIKAKREWECHASKGSGVGCITYRFDCRNEMKAWKASEGFMIFAATSVLRYATNSQTNPMGLLSMCPALMSEGLHFLGMVHQENSMILDAAVKTGDSH